VPAARTDRQLKTAIRRFGDVFRKLGRPGTNQVIALCPLLLRYPILKQNDDRCDAASVLLYMRRIEASG
jgi:hypothetical protein